MGLMGLIMACYRGLYGIVRGLIKSTDHPKWEARHMGGCQNYDPLIGPLDTRCRAVLRTPKGTII